MKILSSYKKIAKEFIKESAWDRKFGEPLPTIFDIMKEADVPDDKMIPYKDKDGEQKKMPAKSAKQQSDEHPAKKAYNKMAGGDKKASGGKVGGDEYERDFDDSEPEDKPFGGDTGKDADFQDEPPEGDADKLMKQLEKGPISDDEWNKVPPKVKKAFRSKVTKIYSTMKKLSDNDEYDKLEKMEEKFGLQLW